MLAYANGLSGPFIFDDQLAIVRNASIREVGLMRSLPPIRESPVAGRPLVNLSFAVNYALGGLDVRGYHAANIAIHLLCALLVYGVGRRTLELPRLRPRFAAIAVSSAFAAALVWELHPLNTEVVDYVTERTESMMALFYLFTLYSSLRALGSARPRPWVALAVLACASGMACKESMVTAPVMVILVDRVFVFNSLRDAVRRRWPLYVGLAATWIVLAVLLSAGPRAHSTGFATGVSAWTYLLNQSVMLTQYLRRAVWPTSLVLNYGVPRPLTLADVLPYVVFVLFLLAATLTAMVRRPAAGFAGLWFFLTLAPTSTIVPIATEVGAERRMYLPLIALVALAVIAARAIGPGSARPAVRHVPAVALLVVCLTFASLTRARTREYASGLSLAETVLARWPTGVAHAMVGTELAIEGRHDEATAHLRDAILDYPRAQYDLGGELFNAGRLDEAVEHLQRFVDEEPLLVEVIQARMLMGQAFVRQHRWRPAREQFERILTMTPANAAARRGLVDTLTGEAIVLSDAGRLDEAVSLFRQAVDAGPRDDRARRNLAAALMNRGDAAGAAREAQEAVTINPADPAGHDLLGRALATQGHLDRARAEFERSLQIDPAFAQAREDLALVTRAIRR